MPDAHEGSMVPNGLVAATRELVYPELVGADLGCGFSAIRLAGRVEGFGAGEGEDLLRALGRAVPTIKRPTCLARSWPFFPPASGLSDEALARVADRDGVLEAGTLGCGNHFIELERDEKGRLWLLVHSGSRALGPRILDHHRKMAGFRLPGRPFSLVLGEAAAQAYLGDAAWALAWAKGNRMALVNLAADVLEAHFGLEVEPDSFIDCPHNFLRFERHGGEDLLVHRKSANSAAEDEPGIIAGSMASGARITRGLGEASSLKSSSHGAGRVLGRAAAAKAITTTAFVRGLGDLVFDRRHAAALRDEAPAAYRDLDAVMAAQRELVRTRERLVPILNDKRPGG